MSGPTSRDQTLITQRKHTPNFRDLQKLPLFSSLWSSYTCALRSSGNEETCLHLFFFYVPSVVIVRVLYQFIGTLLSNNWIVDRSKNSFSQLHLHENNDHCLLGDLDHQKGSYIHNTTPNMQSWKANSKDFNLVCIKAKQKFRGAINLWIENFTQLWPFFFPFGSLSPVSCVFCTFFLYILSFYTHTKI